MKRTILFSVAVIAATMCGTATQAAWVPMITYKPAQGLPSAQGFGLGHSTHWNGVAPAGQQPYFSQMVSGQAGPELYMNTLDYEPRIATVNPVINGVRQHHAWHSDDKPDYQFLQTGFAIETELKMVSFRGTGHGLWIEGQVGPVTEGTGSTKFIVEPRDRMALQFRGTSITLYGLGGNKNIAITDIAASVPGFDYPSTLLANYYQTPYIDDDGNDATFTEHRYETSEGGDYYTYRLEYDPKTQLRLFSVNDVVIDTTPVTNFGGSSGVNDSTRYWFGDGVTNGGAEYYMRSLTFSIPEPTSAALLLAGAVAGLVAFGRKRRMAR